MDKTPNRSSFLPKEFDPRSPTDEFDRTPISIILSASPSSSGKQERNVSFKSVLDDSYESYDMDQTRDDPSPVVSQLSLDMNDTIGKLSEDMLQSSLNVKCEDLAAQPEETELIPSPTEPAVLQPKAEITPEVDVIFSSQVKPSPDISSLATSSPIVKLASPTVDSSSAGGKKIIFSPSMAKASPKKLLNSSFTCHMDEHEPVVSDKENSPQTLNSAKVRSPRTPLASINKHSNSPVNILRARQWKDFQEEREKRGLHDNENILPPFKATPSSVPAKLPVRRRPLV